jgi:transcriptional regulator with XRE-family HTH domain
MPENFGARLRQRREGQQIALGTIAEQTKIKQSLLEALERGDVSQWPSGIFRRAFIRAYAHAIGLEPDVVVREFLEIYPDPAEVIATVPAMAARLHESHGGGPPTRLRNLVGSAIGSLSRIGNRSASKPAVVQNRAVGISQGPGTPTVPALFVEEPRYEDPLDEPMVERAAHQEPVYDPPVYEAADYEPLRPENLPVTQLPVDDASASVARVAVESGLGPHNMVEESGIMSRQRGRAALDLMAVAQVCTELGRIDGATDIDRLLGEATRLLDAVGLIVWLWDGQAVELKPALGFGYSDRVLAQMPRVDHETNNATAAAFRSGQTCVVNSSDLVSGALVVPLLTSAGCAGVLAIELRGRREEEESVRALAMIFAAQLAALIGAAQPAEASDRRLA